MKFTGMLLILFLILFMGCSPEKVIISPASAPPRVDSARIWKDFTTFVPIAPRISGTPTHQEAIDYIKNTLQSAGISCELESFEDETPLGKKVFCNVIGEIKGKNQDEFILLGSHFDTKDIEDFVGANDGGSSTAVLLEILRVYQKNTPPCNIRFAFFDGEECYYNYDMFDGLHGSKYHAQKLKDRKEIEHCKAMILMDLVGDKELQFTLPNDTDPHLLKRFKKLTPPELIAHYHSSIIDDHVPFSNLGIPCINLIDFSFGPNNIYWHSKLDTIENCSIQSLETTGNLVLKLIHHLVK